MRMAESALYQVSTLLAANPLAAALLDEGTRYHKPPFGQGGHGLGGPFVCMRAAIHLLKNGNLEAKAAS